MSITTETLTARADVTKSGWKVTAPHLKAADYPTLSSVKLAKDSDEMVAQVPLFPSNVSYLKYGTADDVRSAAGTNLDSFLVEVANYKSRAEAHKAALAHIANLTDYNGDTIVFDGTTIDIFAPKAEAPKKAAAGSKATQAKSILEAVEGLSESERLERMTKFMLELAAAAK